MIGSILTSRCPGWSQVEHSTNVGGKGKEECTDVTLAEEDGKLEIREGSENLEKRGSSARCTRTRTTGTRDG